MYVVKNILTRDQKATQFDDLHLLHICYDGFGIELILTSYFLQTLKKGTLKKGIMLMTTQSD